MSKIVLFGGSSEIGINFANLILANTSQFDEIQYVSTSLAKSSNTFHWNPSGHLDVELLLAQLVLTKGDLIIIALGYLGEPLLFDESKMDLAEIEKIFTINFHVPFMTLVRTTEALAEVGGGKIIVMTSAAAHPVLNTNLFYGTAKYGLDSMAIALSKSVKAKGVEITVVRSGFVPTKLNRGRRATPFSRTAEQVAVTILKNYDKKIIWTPKYLNVISFILKYVPAAKYFASRKVEDSWTQ